VAAVVVAGLVAVVASSSDAANGVRAGPEGGTLKVGIGADLFDTVDAALTESPATIPVVRAICATLMRNPDKPLPDGYTLVPELATGYPRISNGGKTYTFTIRKGVRFSTGAVVTAADVAHTLNRLLNPVMHAYAARLFRDVVGAQAVMKGKAQEASGVVARGKTLTVKLKRPLGDFAARVAYGGCLVPRALPVDAEGARPPIPTAAPYFVSEYIPARRVVLERNPFYRGPRPHRVDRIEVELAPDSASIIDQVNRGELDYGWAPNADYASRADEFKRKYGVNKSRFFAVPAGFLRMFVLNTSRPLFRDNLALRRAVNFAVDRKALLRERGTLGGFLTDQYLPPVLPGYRDERIYPLKPDVETAKRLARGNLRGGRAVLYAPALPAATAQAQIVKANLQKIGLRVDLKQFPSSLYFTKVDDARRAPFDIAWSGWLADIPDPSLLNDLFEARNIPAPNESHLASRTFDRRLERASRLTGAARYRAYGRIDVALARDAAPAIAYAYDNALTLVSARTGCVVVNPYLDLAAVCLK
jgi:peptide/nickel transport system substrate-binding protein